MEEIGACVILKNKSNNFKHYMQYWSAHKILGERESFV